MPNLRFEPVAVRRRLSGKCPLCGRSVQRSRKFEQTVNPYHSAVRALPGDSTYSDAYDAVLAEVERAADAWVPDFRHADCGER